MNEVKIRKATKSDFQMLSTLVEEFYDLIENKAGLVGQLDREKYLDILSDKQNEIFVAEDNGKVIGYLTLNFNKSLLDVGITAIIDELLITKSYRGKGVGKRLIDAAIEECKQRGCSEIGVATEFSNESGRKFYKSCGFEEIGVIFEKLLI